MRTTAAIGLLACALVAGELDTVVGDAEPLSALPKRVAAPAGALTLFADFADRRGEHVVVYLVNRTGDEIDVPAADGDIYLKLEAELDKGWRRAQTHEDSVWGNSDGSALLPDGHFFRLLGWAPTKGESRRIRFRLYPDHEFSLGGVFSNSAAGFIDPEALDAARDDYMTTWAGAFEEVRAIAAGKLVPREEPEMKREIAIAQLVYFAAREATVPTLKRILDEPELEQDLFECALDVLSEISREQALALCRAWIDNADDPRRALAIEFARPPFGSSPALLARLERIAGDPKDPHFVPALESLSRFGGETLRARLEGLRTDARLTPPQREAVASLFFRTYPETAFEVSAKPNEGTAFEVVARNISGTTITIRDPHPEDFVRFRVREPLPWRPAGGCVRIAKEPLVLKAGEAWTFRVELGDFLMLRPGTYELVVGVQLPPGARSPVWEKAKHAVTIR